MSLSDESPFWDVATLNETCWVDVIDRNILLCVADLNEA